MTTKNTALDIIIDRLNQKRKFTLIASDDECDCTQKVYPFSNENVYGMMEKLDMMRFPTSL